MTERPEKSDRKDGKMERWKERLKTLNVLADTGIPARPDTETNSTIRAKIR